MNPRLRGLGVAGAALLLLSTAACAETTSGTGTRAGAAGSGGATAAAAARTSGPATSISELAAQLIAGTAHGTTVHVSVDTSGVGTDGSPSFEGDQRTKDGGDLDAFHFVIGYGAQSIEMTYTDSTPYVKLPASIRPDPTKPWTKVTSTSSNPEVAAMAAEFDQIGEQTSLSRYAGLVRSATNFGATGVTDVGGVEAQGYSFDIDPTSLPNAKDLGPAISKIGPIPTTLAVDDQGRPVQMTEKVAVDGPVLTVTLLLSHYGEDVTLAAPPADQTSSG